VLGYYAGPTGTQELFEMPLGTKNFENFVATETIAYFTRNSAELRRLLLASGVLSHQDEMLLNVQARMGNIQAVNTLILTRVGQAHEAILQYPNPRESLLVQTFSRFPQDIAGRVAENAGQLVAMCDVNAVKRGFRMLASTDLTPQDVRSDSVLYQLRSSLTKPAQTLVFPIDRPKTLFVAGPGAATAAVLSSYLRFPKSIYADRSPFVASLIRSVAVYDGKRVGETVSNADVVTRSNGMEEAAEEFAGQIDMAQFAMVHSAPREAVEKALNEFGRGIRSGAIISAMLPDKVYPFETTFQTFSEIAKAAGLVQVSFIVEGRQVEVYSYSHPNLTPGREIYDRKIFVGVFKKP